MADSVITQYTEYCLICGASTECEHHLIEGVANRAKSEKWGLKIPLCNSCHNMNANSMHGNTKMNRLGKIMGQIAFEKEFWKSKVMASKDEKKLMEQDARDLFRKDFGKSFV